MHELSIVLGMMLLTFGPRYLPFALAGRFTLPPLLRSALDFVPIAALCAIVSQVTLIHDGKLQLSFTNPYLVAAMVAFFIALITRNMLLTIIAGLISYVVCIWGLSNI